jgi:hypothetical protein
MEKIGFQKWVDEQLRAWKTVYHCPQIRTRGQGLLKILLILVFAWYHIFDNEVLSFGASYYERCVTGANRGILIIPGTVDAK